MKTKNSKIPVTILGATGMVGQKMVSLLLSHPWFEIASLCASENSVGKRFGDIVRASLPSHIADMQIQPCIPSGSIPLAFSALDAKVAGDIEQAYLRAGVFVVSNARNHRLDPTVPLLIPEVNLDHLDVLSKQVTQGKIVTNPNCTTIALALALKPLVDSFGLEAVHVVSLQALSGAGAAASQIDITDNVIPFIQGEEEKIAKEIPKIFGRTESHGIESTSMKISASCNRVGVTDGHLLCVSVKLKKQATTQALIETWRTFSATPQMQGWPTAPTPAIYYLEEEHFPQPKHHRNLGGGMAISIGRLRPNLNFDYQFVVLSHNLIRGAAGGTLLCAEACRQWL